MIDVLSLHFIAIDKETQDNLVKELGWEGYGLFCMITELLALQDDHRLEADYKLLARSLYVGAVVTGVSISEDAEKVKKVVCNFGIFKFTEDGRYFYSERLNKYMEEVKREN